MNRRGFLSAILAAGMAPAIVKAANLMPVRPLLPGGSILGIDYAKGLDQTAIAVRGDGVLQLFSGTPSNGTLLASINMGAAGGSGVAFTTGMFQFARLRHPTLGDIPVHLDLNSHALIPGMPLEIQPLKLTAV